MTKKTSESEGKKEWTITERDFNKFKYLSTGIPILLIGVITVAITHLLFLWVWGIFMIGLGLFLLMRAIIPTYIPIH